MATTSMPTTGIPTLSTSTPYPEKRTRFEDDGQMLQIDGSNSPDSISTEGTEALVVTNSSGRLGADALSEGGSPASESALSSGANSQLDGNGEVDRRRSGEHISLHLTGDLTFLGVTKELTFPVILTDESISADFVFDATLFGMSHAATNDEVRIAFTFTK